MALLGPVCLQPLVPSGYTKFPKLSLTAGANLPLGMGSGHGEEGAYVCSPQALYLVPGGQAASTFVPGDLGMGLPRNHTA